MPPAAAQAGASTGAASQLAQAAGAVNGPPPGHPVTERFRAVKDLVSAPAGAPAPIDATLKAMGAMYTAFNKLAHAPADPAARAEIMNDLQAATNEVLAQKSTLPGPFDQVVAAVADSGNAVAAGGARAYMDKMWHGGGGPLAACTALVANHFPFDVTSADDAPAEDFAKMFAPGGTLDQFFNTHLKAYVDTSGHPWRWQPADGIQIHLSDEALRQFERAAVIGEALFPPDGKSPLVRFDIEPLKVDERINTVILDVDGQQLVYRYGPIKKTAMQWPGKEPTGARTFVLAGPRRAGDVHRARRPVGLPASAGGGQPVAGGDAGPVSPGVPDRLARRRVPRPCRVDPQSVRRAGHHRQFQLPQLVAGDGSDPGRRVLR